MWKLKPCVEIKTVEIKAGVDVFSINISHGRSKDLKNDVIDVRYQKSPKLVVAVYCLVYSKSRNPAEES